jgi:hypothetical protein
MGFAKLYDRETPNIVADLLNDRVVPSMTPMRRRSAVLDEFLFVAGESRKCWLPRYGSVGVADVVAFASGFKSMRADRAPPS